MNNNLARQPALTLVAGKPQPLSRIADIVPADDIPSTSGESRWWPFGEETSRWLGALGIVLLAYATPLAWWLWPRDIPGANLPPPAAMVVELSPAPVAPPSPADMPPDPELSDATPPPPPEPEPLPEPEPEPLPEPEPVPEPEPELPPVPPAPEPEVAVNPTPEPPPEEQPAVQEPTPPEVEEQVEETPPQNEPASIASAPPEAPQEDTEAAAPNQAVSAPVVDQNRVMNWQSSLMLKLNEAKRYPSRARRRREEGVTYLRFRMDREGAVLSASIEQSSGHTLLDNETLALVERVEPLPVPPDDMPGESLEFVVPVEFFLNR